MAQVICLGCCWIIQPHKTTRYRGLFWKVNRFDSETGGLFLRVINYLDFLNSEDVVYLHYSTFSLHMKSTPTIQEKVNFSIFGKLTFLRLTGIFIFTPIVSKVKDDLKAPLSYRETAKNSIC